MNKPNNKRKKASQEKIEKVFLNLIQAKDINEISITTICKLAHLNRSTFYANYLDIYDLADKIADKLENEVGNLYQMEKKNKYNSNENLKLFKHIKKKQMFYKTYFKLKKDEKFIIQKYDTNLSKNMYNDKFIDYHIEFFKAGLNAIIRKWLEGGCKETPEEIDNIIKDEYKNKNINSKN